MAEPIEVCIKGREEVIGYACPTCKLFCSPMIYACKWEDAMKAAHRVAAECCDKYCTQCNAPLPGRADQSQLPSPWHYTVCPACKKVADEKKDDERYAKATKVPEAEYTGPVYWEDGPGSHEGYFADMCELRDYVEDDADELPDWVWACDTRGMNLSAESIIENELSNHYDDAYEHLGAKAEETLQQVLDQWVKEHAGNIQSWDPDNSRVVMVNKEAKANEDREEAPQGAGGTEEGRGESASGPRQ